MRTRHESHWHQALHYDRRYVRPGQLYLRLFRGSCTVIMTLRRVKCPSGPDDHGTLPLMTKPAISTRQSHKSPRAPSGAALARRCPAGAGRPEPGRAGLAAGHRSAPGRRVAGLVFAPVRPGFGAACMVDSPDSRRVPGAGRTALARLIRNRQREYFADGREVLGGRPGRFETFDAPGRPGRKTCSWLR